MAEPLSIAVIGAGQWGTTLAWLCAKKGVHARLYDHNAARAAEIQNTRRSPRFTGSLELPRNVSVGSDLTTATDGAQIVFVVVPSKNLRETARALAACISPKQFLVHGIKGLEMHTQKRMSQVLVEETSCLRVGALSGPNLADEILQGLPAAAAIASRYDEVIAATQAALSQPGFWLQSSHDIVGVEWMGALKNILAVASGLVHGLRLGTNAQALVLTRGVAEIQQLLAALGAQNHTLLGLAGLGDIFATCTSPHSRNFQAGALLAGGKSPETIQTELHTTVEGLSTLEAVMELAESMKEKGAHLPSLALLETLQHCMQKAGSASGEIERLLTRGLDFIDARSAASND